MQLVIHPDELLRETSERITDIDGETFELAENMITTMHSARGIGLAGVQVGILKRIFVVHVDRDKPRVFINPTIIETSMDQIEHEEGCLSIPAIYANVTRPEAIRIQAWNEKGRPFTVTLDGLVGRVVQHEYDHLSGVLFLDHLAETTRDRVMTEYKPVAKPASAAHQ
jgi:peptide deformylase